MLYELLRHIKNFFPLPYMAMTGEFKIENHTISLPNMLNGQYFLIEGSVLNDGVYAYPCTTLKNETFNGIITPLAIPPDVISLASEITQYKAKYGDSPYVSESFGGYSYTKGTNGKGEVMDWRDVYKSRLNAWRKV